MAAGKVQGPLLPQILQRQIKLPRYKVIDEPVKMRSASTMAGVDHICIYIPAFDFDADLRFQISDDFKRFNLSNAGNRFTWFVERNPQANPC